MVIFLVLSCCSKRWMTSQVGCHRKVCRIKWLLCSSVRDLYVWTTASNCSKSSLPGGKEAHTEDQGRMLKGKKCVLFTLHVLTARWRRLPSQKPLFKATFQHLWAGNRSNQVNKSFPHPNQVVLCLSETSPREQRWHILDLRTDTDEVWSLNLSVVCRNLYCYHL